MGTKNPTQSELLIGWSASEHNWKAADSGVINPAL